MVGVDDSAGSRLPILDRHIERVDDKGGVLDIVDRPADCLSGERIHDGVALGFALSRWNPSRGMLRDIRNPYFVR